MGPWRVRHDWTTIWSKIWTWVFLTLGLVLYPLDQSTRYGGRGLGSDLASNAYLGDMEQGSWTSLDLSFITNEMTKWLPKSLPTLDLWLCKTWSGVWCQELSWKTHGFLQDKVLFLMSYELVEPIKSFKPKALTTPMDGIYHTFKFVEYIK